MNIRREILEDVQNELRRLYEVGDSEIYPRRLSRNSKELTNNGRYIGQTSSLRYLEVSPYTDQLLSSRYSGVGKRLSFRTIERMRVDPIISFALGLISSMLRSLPYSISCSDKMQERVLRHALKKNYDSIVENLFTAVYNGFSISQKLWEKEPVTFVDFVENEDGSIEKEVVFRGNIDSIKKVKGINPYGFNLKYTVDLALDELVNVKQFAGTNKEIKVERDELIHLATNSAFDKIFGFSKLQNIFKEWEISLILYRYLLDELDKNAQPPLVVNYRPGISVDQITNTNRQNADIARDILEEIIESDGAALPSEFDRDGNKLWDISVLDKWKNQGAEFLLKKFEFFNIMKVVGLSLPSSLSPFAASQKGISSGEVEVGLEMLLFSQEYFVNEMEKTIVNDFLTHIQRINFRQSDIIPFEFKIDRSVFNKRLMTREIIQTLIRGNIQLLGTGKIIPNFFPDLKALLEQNDIPYSSPNEIFKFRTEVDISGDSNAGEVNPLDDKEQQEKDNGENRITKRRSRARREGGSE